LNLERWKGNPSGMGGWKIALRSW